MSPLHADYAVENEQPKRLPTDAAGGPATEQGRRQRTVQPGAAVSTWKCLVLSADADRRRRLLGITENAGWRPLECESVGAAMRQADRWKTYLAVIDFCGLKERQRQTFRKFAERLGKQTEPLLMICDDDDSSSIGELWARQLGVWLYLPEVSLGDELVELCAEAFRATEKQALAQATLLADAVALKQR